LLTRRLNQDAAASHRLLDDFCTVWRPQSPAFIEYFDRMYVDKADLWMRSRYLCRFPEELHAFIPTGTQGAESGFGHMKRIELAHMCALRVQA
jgi:hypothetical protein